MSITRWDPWTEAMSLREAMDSLLQESVVRPRTTGRAGGIMPLALDVEERGDDFVITAPIPGMKPEDVDDFGARRHPADPGGAAGRTA